VGAVLVVARGDGQQGHGGKRCKEGPLASEQGLGGCRCRCVFGGACAVSLAIWRGSRRRIQYSLPSPPSSRNSRGGMPKPLSSTVHAPRAKSMAASILVACASSALWRSASTTPASDTMAVDDLIWATTSGGSGRMGGVCAMAPAACLWSRHGFAARAVDVSWARRSRQARHVGRSAGLHSAGSSPPARCSGSPPPPCTSRATPGRPPAQHRNTKHQTPNTVARRPFPPIASARPLGPATRHQRSPTTSAPSPRRRQCPLAPRWPPRGTSHIRAART
jgi:hypothetical protein